MAFSEHETTIQDASSDTSTTVAVIPRYSWDPEQGPVPSDEVKVVKRPMLPTEDKVSLKGVVDTLEADLKAFEENEGALAGDVAIRALMALRRLKEQNSKKRTKFWVRLFMFLFIVGGGIGGFGYWASTQVVKTRNVMTRTCSAQVGSNTFTGTREFSYLVKTLFGFQLIDKSQVEESTKLDIRGSKVNIIGLKDGKFAWRRNITDGERYDQLLKEADTYILFTDKETTVVPYELFCK
jgi:hypothetical protein